MAGMTAEQVFAARELHRDGIWSGRIAELLEVDERDVRRALNGDDFEPYEPPPDSPPAAPAEPKPVDPNAWPPPIDESTEWSTVRPVAPGSNIQSAEVRVRSVILWGKRVWINDADEVFCDWCHRAFRTTAQLGHPRNSCPVGIVRPPGLIYAYNPDDDPDPEWTNRPVGGPRFVDFMREPM